MKIKLATSCFIIATLLGQVAAHAAESATDSTHPKTFVKDSVITTKVKAKLANEKLSSLAHINVDTHSKGEVVLSGKVTSQEEADKAVSIARNIEGVTSVKSKLQIKKED
jgi:hyperosmotically inducible protein